MTPRTTSHADRRRGLVIIPAIVALVVVTIFCGVLLNQMATYRRVIRAEERRMQAEWLAESALQRASARLESDRSFRGETWVVPPEDLDGHSATATIVVEPVEGKPDRRRLRVEAVHPREGELRARITRTLELNLRPDTPGDRS